jgi:uncharacterized RDD family membrane protein YckC
LPAKLRPIRARCPPNTPVNDLQPEALPTASVKSRLMAMVYETMLMLAVLFVAALPFAALLEQRHALYRRDDLQYWLFVVLGIYFCWFWRHGGQTLAMKTWRIRLLTREGSALSLKQAALRYVLAWLWFLPGLAAARYLHVQGWMLVLFPALNMALWILAIFLDPDWQFPHDRLAGTRLAQLPPMKAADKSTDPA